MKLRAITRIHRLSGGIPRLINTICDRSLMAAYAAQKDSVDARMVGKAASEVMGGSRLFFSRRVAVPVLLLLILMALAAGWKYFLPKYLPEKSLEAMGTHEAVRVPADSFSEKRQSDEKRYRYGARLFRRSFEGRRRKSRRYRKEAAEKQDGIAERSFGRIRDVQRIINIRAGESQSQKRHVLRVAVLAKDLRRQARKNGVRPGRGGRIALLF